MVSSYHRGDRFIPAHRRKASFINPRRQAGLEARALLTWERAEKKSARAIAEKLAKIKHEEKRWRN